MLSLSYFAHEVYVISPEQITKDEHQKSINVFTALNNAHNLRLFLVIGALSTLAFGLALFLKKSDFFKHIGSFLDRCTIIAPDIIRIAFGLSLLVSAKHNAIFGPELPLSNFSSPSLLRIVLVVLGVGLILGILTRLFALAAIVLYALIFISHGWYALTYVNYLGEAIAVSLLPSQLLSLDSLLRRLRHTKPKKYVYEKYSMPATRIFFGASLLYAAINVKYATTSLSLDVVRQYGLTRYFPFDPLFVVFGAMLVECGIALLYISGLLRRLNSLLFLGFIITSLLFFKEAVWPHYLLIATALGIFLHKADDLSMDARIFSGTKKHQQ